MHLFVLGLSESSSLLQVNMETMLKKIVEYDYERVSFLKKLYIEHSSSLDLESVQKTQDKIE